jgi:hypothetical protein
MPGLDLATAHRYLTARHLTGDLAQRLIELAAGSWLVLTLAADLATRTGTVTADSITELYTDLLERIRDRHGEQAGQVLTVLAAAGPGPVLPFDVLADALGRLGPPPPLSRAELYALRGDPDLYPLLDRARPGRADEHLGLFHQTLIDHILTRSNAQQAHQAIADSLDQLAPAEQHDPKTYRDDPLLGYAFTGGPRRLWEAGRPEFLVDDLERREDPVPRVNLTRWTSFRPHPEQSRPRSPQHVDHSRQHRLLDGGGRGGGRGAAAVPRAATRPAAGARPGPPDHAEHPP